MKSFLRNIYTGKYGLLLLAVLFFALSFVFNKLYSNRSSVSLEVKKLERYLARQQKDFDDFLSDTSLINRLLVRKESLQEFNQLAEKPYGIFLYQGKDFGETKMVCWCDQMINPSPEMVAANDG